MKLNPRLVCILRHGYFPMDVRILKEARALRDAGYTVDVICLRRQGQTSREICEGFNVFRIELGHIRGSLVRYALEYGLSFIVMAVVVTMLFVRRRYACIQVNTMPDFLVFATLIPKLLGARILLDLHEPVPELWATKFGRSHLPGMEVLLAYVEQAAIRFCDHALTVNETIKRRFVERGAQQNKITIVRNVPDEVIITSSVHNSKREGLTLITHGTIEKYYGHAIMLNALIILRGKINLLRLIIIGDGKYRRQLESIVRSNGLSDMVTFTGWIPYERVMQFILEADAGLITHIPSPFMELAQPNKLFEYVALKKLVITSPYAAILETFDDSCLLFFEPGSAKDLARCILQVYKQPENIGKFVDNAFQKYIPICWKNSKKVYLKAIRDCIKS